MSLLTRSSLRHLAGHRAQLLLSIVGVALGVAVVLSIDATVRSARTAFRVSAETVSGRATHRIHGTVAPVPDGLLVRLRTELGVRAAAPVVEGWASSPRTGGRALRVLGVDPFSEGPFRPFVARGGPSLDVGAFVTTPGAVVLSVTTAARAGVWVGDTLPVVVAGEAHRLPVLGVLDPADPLERSGLADVLVMDLSGAQDLLRAPGVLSRIDLRLDGEGGDEVVARVRASLPPGLVLEPAGARAATMAGMIAAFDVNLTALSLLALIFGMFLIYNAVTFSVVQRRAVLGRLRALGVTRAEILRLILLEATVLGAAGALLGSATGALLARGLLRLVTRTINDLYFTVSVEGVSLEPALFAKAAALGIGATLLAALPPALEASRASPRLASLRSVAEVEVRVAIRRAAAIGLATAVAGGLLTVVPGTSLLWSFAALFLVIAGLALTTPAGSVLLVGAVRPLLTRAAGTLGTMASRDVVRSASRTAPAMAALVVAVSVTVGLGVMIQSFRGTLVRWLDATLRADVYVSVPGPIASRASGTLWPDLVDAFVAHPAVVGHNRYRGIDVVGADGAFHLVAVALDPRGERAIDLVDGDPGAVMSRFQADEGALVSEPFAYRRGIAVGDSIRLPTPAGAAAIPVLGVFYDYGSDQGAVMIGRGLYDGLYADRGVTSLGLFLDPAAESEAVVAELLGLVREGRSVTVRTNDALRAGSLEVFDRTFEVTAVLRALAFVVAFVGVLSALMAIELERARELGVLRATGLTPGQLRGLVVTQTGLIGLVSGVLAVPVGLVLAVVMIFVVNKRSFGWTLRMEIGPEVVVQAILLALVGALVAGVYPAWRMSRTSPAVALRGE